MFRQSLLIKKIIKYRMQRLVILTLLFVYLTGCQQETPTQPISRITYLWQPRYVIARVDVDHCCEVFPEEPSHAPQILVYSDGTVIRTDKSGIKTGKVSLDKICELLIQAQKSGFYAFDRNQYDQSLSHILTEDSVRLEVNGWQERGETLAGLQFFDESGKQKLCATPEQCPNRQVYTTTLPSGPAQTLSLISKLAESADTLFVSDRILMRISDGYNDAKESGTNWPANLPPLKKICDDPKIGLRLQGLQSINCIAGFMVDTSQMQSFALENPARLADGIFFKENEQMYLVKARYALPHELGSSAGKYVAQISTELDSTQTSPFKCVNDQ